VPATPENVQAAGKEHQKIQSQPRLRSLSPQGDGLHWLFGGGFRSEPEPAPEDLYTGHVRNLVGSTITAAAQDPDKDVLVNCFAPWCGHCQRFKPNYKELARRLSHVSTLVISWMDCTQNDLGPLKGIVMGYPTVALFPAGSSKVSLYVGNRSPEDMMKWLHTKVAKAFSDTPSDTAEDGKQEGLLGKDDDL